jgi:hypothetical protein
MVLIFPIVCLVLLVKIFAIDGFGTTIKVFLIALLTFVLARYFLGALLAWCISDIGLLFYAYKSGAISQL